jgi:hypothetical protein
VAECLPKVKKKKVKKAEKMKTEKEKKGAMEVAALSPS